MVPGNITYFMMSYHLCFMLCDVTIIVHQGVTFVEWYIAAQSIYEHSVYALPLSTIVKVILPLMCLSGVLVFMYTA